MPVRYLAQLLALKTRWHRPAAAGEGQETLTLVCSSLLVVGNNADCLIVTLTRYAFPMSNTLQALASRLKEIQGLLTQLHFEIPFAAVAAGNAAVNESLNQLKDYILPRLEQFEAPLLTVIGGSTGSGKSTLVNSLVGEDLARASAIRPTTRRPLLICNPADISWFQGERIFPSLARVFGDNRVESISEGQAITEIAVATSAVLPLGLAVLDAPDIDSVARENRELAAQLMKAADLWLFVTTAHRYADAIPWRVLDEAAGRNIAIGIVLNRVPAGVETEVVPDLQRRLREAGINQAPLFTIHEDTLTEGRLPEDAVCPIRDWLIGIGRDAKTRAEVAKQTLRGAVEAFATRGAELETIVEQYLDEVVTLQQRCDSEYDTVRGATEKYLADGTLLRGEVLSRWQDLVGTTQWAAKLEAGVSAFRDRLTGFFTGGKPNVAPVEAAIENQMYAFLSAQGELTVTHVLSAWEQLAAAAGVTAKARASLRSPAERENAAAALVREWQTGLIDLISEQGAGKKFKARALSLGVNSVGVALIIVVFASTGGLVGGEIAVAGGTAVVAQRLLEAIFGDEAVRKMAHTARQDFLTRTAQFFAADQQIFHQVLEESSIPEQLARQLGTAYEALQEELPNIFNTRQVAPPARRVPFLGGLSTRSQVLDGVAVESHVVEATTEGSGN